MYVQVIQENAVLYTVISVIWYVLLAAGLWRTFDKAGEAGWKAIIPFYNFYILFKIAWQGKMFWWFIAAVILTGVFATLSLNSNLFAYLSIALMIVTSVMVAVLWYDVSLAYGHGLGYFLGLYFLNPIFIMILGFGSSRYIGNRYQLS